jgi:hypothetical protein
MHKIDPSPRLRNARINRAIDNVNRRNREKTEARLKAMLAAMPGYVLLEEEEAREARKGSALQ